MIGKTAFFIEDKALFGGYPSSQEIINLENFGVRWFINLTYENEKYITPYTTKYNKIDYPIKDKDIPSNRDEYNKFVDDLIRIIENLKKDEKIYIHCKGGIGRSGLVVASILCKLYKYSPYQSIKLTNNFHMQKNIEERWKRITSPQTKIQKNFIYTLFNKRILV